MSGESSGTQRRRGFALITALWMMVSASIVALAAMLAAREGYDASRNRVNAERALWRAEGCAARARAAIDEALSSDPEPAAAAWYWRELAREAPRSPYLAGSGCDIGLEAAGTLVDVNSADTVLLAGLFRAMGRADEADDLASALVEWRRTRPFSDVREIGLVSGFDTDSAPTEYLSTEAGRISLNTAPLVVLAALPGFTSHLLQRIQEWRDAGRPVTDLMALAATLPPDAMNSLMAHYPEVVALTTTDPDAWVLTSRGHAGQPSVTTTYELRLVRAGSRAAVMRRRVWR